MNSLRNFFFKKKGKDNTYTEDKHDGKPSQTSLIAENLTISITPPYSIFHSVYQSSPNMNRKQREHPFKKAVSHHYSF